MTSFERILFPVDFSDQSWRSIPYVADLATRFHSEVTILHVIDIPVAWYTPPDVAMNPVVPDLDSLRENRGEQLERFACSEFEGLSVVRQMTEGDVANQIACYAKTHHSNLIMMPTHGYGTFRRMLLGSVTAKVLNDACCPVWTGVHIRELEPAKPRSFSNILCAIDTNPKDVAVLKWVKEFACSQNAHVRLVHAVPAAALGDTHVNRSLREFLFQVSRDQIERLQAEAGTSFELILHGGKPQHVVHDEVLDQPADLVVIGRGLDHHIGRLRSNAYAIIREAPVPVVSI